MWRDKAIARMLEAGMIFEPLGTNLHPASISDGQLRRSIERNDGTTGAHATQLPPYRPPVELLCSKAQSRSLATDFRFRLTHLVRGGVDMPAQEWRAEAVVRGVPAGQILVKILVDELRYPGRLVTVPEQSAQERESSEMCAYARLQSLQGRHVSHCSGAFSFEMPWGNTVTGILLEDLTGESETLPNFVKRKLDQLQGVDQIDPLVRACFDLVHRVQAAGITAARLWADDFRVLEGSLVRAPFLCLSEFSVSSPTEEYGAFWLDFADPEVGGPWQMPDEQTVLETLQNLFGDVLDDWWRRLMKEDVDYLHLAQHVRRLKEEEGV